jgi:hypothetical protein
LVFAFYTYSTDYNYLDDVSVVDNNAPSIQLLNNPSFETSTTNITGWTTWCASPCTGAGGYAGKILANSTCHSGNCYIDHCRTNYYDFLVQSFPATIGDTYTISFWLQQTGTNTIRFYANIES